MTFMKTRAIPSSNRSFSDQGRRQQQHGGPSRFKQVEGKYDSFWPVEGVAQWWAICPDQAWSFEQYNSETGAVETLADQFYLRYVKHYIPRNKQKFYCSATAHKDKPCWGCGIRNAFYDQQRVIRENTGVKPDGEAPVSAMTQFAFAGVVLEHFVKVQAKDKNGRGRTNQEGKPIMYDTALPLLTPAEQKAAKAKGGLTFGKSVHYSVGTRDFNTLLAFDQQLRNYCASCGEHLYAMTLACPECAQEFQANDEGEPVTGQDLAQIREAEFNCDCGYKGSMLPMVSCGCGSPVEGQLTSFALRLISRKVSETSKILEFTEVRPLHMIIAKYPVIETLLATPLKLNEIFEATPIALQNKIVPEELRGDGVSPAARAPGGGKASAPAAAYPLGDDAEDEPAF